MLAEQTITCKGSIPWRYFAFGVFLLCIGWLQATAVWAAGTPAGTEISNNAVVDYIVDGTSFAQTSNTTTMLVDEILNVVGVWQDAASIEVNPSDVNRVLTFRITNTGNGGDDYTLSTNSALSGDNFDPTPAGIYLDDNRNGTYEAGTDPLYVAGINDPILPADSAITVFILNHIPGNVSEGDQGLSRLQVTSKTGTGTPGSAVADSGDGGTYAVMGTSGGQAAATGSYTVLFPEVSVVKTMAIADPYGTAEPVTGAVITYTITVTVSGTGTASALVLTDPIPADTTYNAGTLTLNSNALTDASDDDAGDVGGTTPGEVTVNVGDLTTASGIQSIAFKVTIN